MKIFGIHHYITKHKNVKNGNSKAAAWIQVDLFGKCWCLWTREIEI